MAKKRRNLRFDAETERIYIFLLRFKSFDEVSAQVESISQALNISTKQIGARIGVAKNNPRVREHLLNLGYLPTDIPLWFAKTSKQFKPKMSITNTPPSKSNPTISAPIEALDDLMPHDISSVYDIPIVYRDSSYQYKPTSSSMTLLEELKLITDHPKFQTTRNNVDFEEERNFGKQPVIDEKFSSEKNIEPKSTQSSIDNQTTTQQRSLDDILMYLSMMPSGSEKKQATVSIREAIEIVDIMNQNLQSYLKAINQNEIIKTQITKETNMMQPINNIDNNEIIKLKELSDVIRRRNKEDEKEYNKIMLAIGYALSQKRKMKKNRLLHRENYFYY